MVCSFQCYSDTLPSDGKRKQTGPGSCRAVGNEEPTDAFSRVFTPTRGLGDLDFSAATACITSGGEVVKEFGAAGNICTRFVNYDVSQNEAEGHPMLCRTAQHSFDSPSYSEERGVATTRSPSSPSPSALSRDCRSLSRLMPRQGPRTAEEQARRAINAGPKDEALRAYRRNTLTATIAWLDLYEETPDRRPLVFYQRLSRRGPKFVTLAEARERAVGLRASVTDSSTSSEVKTRCVTGFSHLYTETLNAVSN